MGEQSREFGGGVVVEHLLDQLHRERRIASECGHAPHHAHGLQVERRPRVPGGGELPCERHLLATVARRAEEREEQPVRPSSGGIVFDALFDGVHQVGEPFGDAAEQLRRELGEDLPHERVRVAGHHVDKAIDGGLQFPVSLQPFEPEPSDRLEHAVPVGRPLTNRQDEHAGVDRAP